MRHTSKMLMIPEELYRSLMMANGNTGKKGVGVDALAEIPTALDSTHAQMQRELQQQQQQSLNTTRKQAENDSTGNGTGDCGVDGQQIRFTGAYKRYRKLLQDERERPQPVSVRNLPELEENVRKVAAAAMTAATTTTNPKAAHTKTGEPSNRRKRKLPAATSTAAAGKQTSHQNIRSSRTSSDSTIVESGENDDEVFSTASEQAEGTSQQQKQQERAEDYYATPERVQQRREEVMRYVSKNAQQLGLTDQLQLLRAVRGGLVPMKTSSLDKILDYHWSSPAERGNRNPPSGYTTFMQTARENAYLAHRLFSPNREQERRRQPSSKRQPRTNSNRTLSGKGSLKVTKENLHKKQHGSFIPFKPTLW